MVPRMRRTYDGLMDDGAKDDAPDRATRLPWLADWRRRVAQLYVEVRARAATDPAGAWELWRAEREALYRGHPQSPVPAAFLRCSQP